MNEDKRRRFCSGCRQDSYNYDGTPGGCWGLRDAKIVTRYKLGWHTRPDSPGAFTAVKTLTCHTAPGRYAMSVLGWRLQERFGRRDC